MVSGEALDLPIITLDPQWLLDLAHCLLMAPKVQEAQWPLHLLMDMVLDHRRTITQVP